MMPATMGGSGVNTVNPIGNKTYSWRYPNCLCSYNSRFHGTRLFIGPFVLACLLPLLQWYLEECGGEVLTLKQVTCHQSIPQARFVNQSVIWSGYQLHADGSNITIYELGKALYLCTQVTLFRTTEDVLSVRFCGPCLSLTDRAVLVQPHWWTM